MNIPNIIKSCRLSINAVQGNIGEKHRWKLRTDAMATQDQSDLGMVTDEFRLQLKIHDHEQTGTAYLKRPLCCRCIGPALDPQSLKQIPV